MRNELRSALVNIDAHRKASYPVGPTSGALDYAYGIIERLYIRTFEKELSETLAECMRKHVKKLIPGTLKGTDLYFAQQLREIDGEDWQPWCETSEAKSE